MAAHKGITNKFGLTTPTVGYAQETRKKGSRTWIYTPNESGVTVEVDPIPYTTYDINMKGIGLADFSLVTAGVTAAGTAKILSVARDESNSGKKTFEYTARQRVNDDLG